MRLSFRKTVLSVSLAVIAVTTIPGAAQSLMGQTKKDSANTQAQGGGTNNGKSDFTGGVNDTNNGKGVGNVKTGYVAPASPSPDSACATKRSDNAADTGYHYGCGAPATPNDVQTTPAQSGGGIDLAAGCKITFNLDGGINAKSNETPVTYGQSITFAAPTREGYKFEGWFQGDKEVKTFSCAGNDTALTAKWTKLTTVTPTPTPVAKKSYSLKMRVQFTMNSSALSKEAKAEIKAMVKKIPAKAEGVVINITGYVQKTPGSKNDMQLSMARAKVVANEFKKYGVKATYKMSGVGVLDKKPTSRQSIITIEFKN